VRFLLESILDHVACPVCLSDLILYTERKASGEIIEGRLVCSENNHRYPVRGGIPILTPLGTKPYDWLSKELTDALKRYEPKEAIRLISDGKIGPRRLSPDDQLLTSEELKDGEYKESERFLQDSYGSIEKAHEHFQSQHNEDRKVFDAMVTMGGLEKADKILDVGTGYGYMLQFLAEQFKSALIFSIDVSYTNLKAVRGRLKKFSIDGNVHLVVADAHRPPFPDGQFGTVESWGGQGNIVGFCRIFGQAYRVLRDRGWFVTDIGGGLERADRDTRTLIEAVGEEFFLASLRKLGLLPEIEESVKAMKQHGFYDISKKKINSTYILSGKK